MKRRLIFILVIIYVVFLQGCNRSRQILEDLTLTLVVGMDLDEENNLIIYTSSPVFSEEAEKKSEEYGVKSQSLRQSRGKFDARVAGLTTGGKVQVILLGKKILQQENWFRLLDLMYREPDFSTTARVVCVDGTVSELIQYQGEDKPRLSIQLTKLIDTANERNIVVKTNLKELHRQMYEKGVTPAITEIKKNQDVILTGTALLDKSGKYAFKLNIEKNPLLHILQHQVKGDLSLSLSLPELNESNSVFSNNETSFVVQQLKRKINVNYKMDKFHFDIQLNMPIYFKERLFTFDTVKNEKKMEKMIEEQLEKQFKNLIQDFQEHEIDPIGLGMYARAYQYDSWKKVQNQWGEAMGKAEFNVSVKIDIKDSGIIK
ncbi:Ger(x)C family spore germination protein [Bacillus sp. 7884-1]|uniref:Ger(x)C family spore germination protein n=1 Tax=Bacillus sp. 7884-1 TaxID=2021693 RepID=UPI000BA5D5B1|nr:Ger(x)C family spore germination protein [Bacillus sp. 7884-1]PAE39397.1 spore gernimation protein [Bacillus sp. 7884-1]